MAMGSLEEAERVILQEFQYQTENSIYGSSGSVMLGHVLKCMGYLRMRQELFEESHNHYTEALLHVVATTGHNCYEASLLCAKLGLHHTRLDQFETASIYLDQARGWLSAHEFYTPEVTYVYYKMAKLCKAQMDDISANEYLAKTERLYSKLVPDHDRKRRLTDAEIDGLLILTSR